jgi:hypothetical protein
MSDWLRLKAMSKYHNKKVVFNNIKFDSKFEAKRYGELLLLEKAGAITNLELQKSFELIPTQYETLANGKRGKCLERAVTYKADFVYIENGKQVVEDVKGMKTKDYIIKRKLMLHKYGIKIKEVRK